MRLDNSDNLLDVLVVFPLGVDEGEYRVDAFLGRLIQDLFPKLADQLPEGGSPKIEDRLDGVDCNVIVEQLEACLLRERPADGQLAHGRRAIDEDDLHGVPLPYERKNMPDSAELPQTGCWRKMSSSGRYPCVVSPRGSID